MSTPPPTEKNFLKEGVAAYNAGRYREAVGLLGTALSSDFNNAVLHYYMANSFVHMKQPESAIREFRIAYALEPSKEVGKFSKQALIYMGALEDEKRAASKVTKAPPAPPKDKVLDQALQSLHKQADNASGLNSRQNSQIASDIARQQQQMDKARNDLMDQFRYTDWRGRTHQLPLPFDFQSNLNGLRSSYDRQNWNKMQMTQKKSEELQKSAQNLEELLHDKGKGTAHRLVPAGTNLYIRNYQSTKKTEPVEELKPVQMKFQK